MFIETIDKEIFLKPLQIVIGIVDRKQTMPILSNVLIEKQNGNLRFTASDMEVQISTDINVDITSIEEESFTVNGKKLQEILRVLPDHCKINVDIYENKIQIKSNKSRFSLQTLPVEDFPKLNTQFQENSNKIVLQQNELKKLLISVQYAMAQQDVRYYLNGVLLIFEKLNLKAVATDGHRLAYNNLCINNENFVEKQEIILPRKTVLELIKLLGDTDEYVELEFTKQQIKVSFSHIALISKVIEGKFPDYERVIPKYVNHLNMERSLVQQALQRTAILCNEKSRGVRFVLTEKNLVIISNNSEQEEAQEEIENDYHGEALDIGFNINYLIEGLNNIGSSTVTFSFGDPNSSILITNPNNSEYRYVVMPMRI